MKNPGHRDYGPPPVSQRRQLVIDYRSPLQGPQPEAFKRYSSIVETCLVRCASTTQGMTRSAFPPIPSLDTDMPIIIPL